VVVPLPAARRPISSDVFVSAYGQLHGYGLQAAIINPLVINRFVMSSVLMACGSARLA
jgi:hypothetical protein